MEVIKDNSVEVEVVDKNEEVEVVDKDNDIESKYYVVSGRVINEYKVPLNMCEEALYSLTVEEAKESIELLLDDMEEVSYVSKVPLTISLEDENYDDKLDAIINIMREDFREGASQAAIEEEVNMAMHAAIKELLHDEEELAKTTEANDE